MPHPIIEGGYVGCACSLLANDPRMTMWATVSFFKKRGANMSHISRQPANHAMPWSKWIDASSH